MWTAWSISICTAIAVAIRRNKRYLVTLSALCGVLKWHDRSSRRTSSEELIVVCAVEVPLFRVCKPNFQQTLVVEEEEETLKTSSSASAHLLSGSAEGMKILSTRDLLVKLPPHCPFAMFKSP